MSAAELGAFPSDLFLIPPEYGWPLAIVAAMMVGFAKSGIPGMGIVIVPVMAMLFPANVSVGILLPMLSLADFLAVGYYRRHAIWKHIWLTLPWAGAGIGIAFLTMLWVNPSDVLLKRFLGVSVLAIMTMNWVIARKRAKEGGELKVPESWMFSAFVGLAGGFMTFAANAAGPIWTLYLLAMRLPKHAFIGTGAWLFLILNLSKIPLQWYRGVVWWESIKFNLLMLPAILAGGLIGIYLVGKIKQTHFDRIVKALTLAAAIKLLF